MKILSSVCLSFVVAVSATSFCLGEEKARDSLPEVLLDRENEFEADVRRLPSEAGDADSDGANMAFAFRTPRLFDGPVTWLVAWDEEEPGAEPWRVIAEDGSIFGVFQPVSDDLALYPEIAKRFPTAKSLQRLRIAREKLDESRRYEAVLTIGDDAKSPLGVSVNAAFGGVGARDADPVRKVVIPEGWIPSPLVMELVEQIRALQGDAAAFDFLLAQLMKKADRWSEFSSLFSKVWDERSSGRVIRIPCGDRN